jgi:hypothetical protein
MMKKPEPSNSWSIPNWCEPDSYGDTRRWGENRWRWEFTRRREDCRADFLAHKDDEMALDAKVLQRLGVKPGRRLQPHEPGFIASVPGCYEKYGISKLPNPAIGDQPFYILMFALRRPAMVMYPEDGINGSLFSSSCSTSRRRLVTSSNAPGNFSKTYKNAGLANS